MYLTLFAHLFGDLALQETRVITTRRDPRLPDDEYALMESYCTDQGCDCRRVMLSVVGRNQGWRFLASISYGFDRDEEMAGPFLDPLNPQSVYADTLFGLVLQVLDDPAYVARLEQHYQLVKQAASDPAHPVHAEIRRLERADRRRTSRLTRQVRRRRR